MYQNYLKTALRSSKRGKLHSIINLLGLTSGMAVILLLGLWLWDEVSFNHYHGNYNRIAKVIQNVTNNGEVQTWTEVPFPLAEEIKENYGSDFERIAMGTGMWDYALMAEGHKFYRKGIFFEAEAPQMLSLQMIYGSQDDLKDPSSVFLSESTSKAIFSDADPMNKVLRIEDDMEVSVTGVYKNIPENSDFSWVEFIAPFELYYMHLSWMKTIADPWRPNTFNLYVQLTKTASIAEASARIREAKLKNVNEDLAKKKPELFLHPMSKWHLYSEFENGVNTGGRIRYVWLFGIIGIFVLLMACINFMNLSTPGQKDDQKKSEFARQ